jgi:hypothetical protein
VKGNQPRLKPSCSCNPSTSVSDGALNLITSAVTPAVMISATAILISGISSKHASLAERVRSLAAEYRTPGTSESRRRNLSAQAELFIRRIRFIAWAHMGLYVASGFFVLMVLAITASRQSVVYPLFLIGVLFLLVSVVLEVVELRLANRTLALEVGDIPGAKQ